MGEAARRKKLDSNYGKPNYLKILIDYSYREYPKYYKREIWIDLATHFVPQEILDSAVSFSRNMMGYTPPIELQESFPPLYPNSLIEIEWNSIIKEWIIEFMMDLDKSQSLTDSQGTNGYENLKRAIALYVQKFRGDDDNYDNEVIEELDFEYNYFIAEAKNSKFPADDIWDYTFDENGSGGDLDFCLAQLYDYITIEIDLNYSFWDLEIMEEPLELLYQKKILEVRQQCLESGSAYGENWSITHHTLFNSQSSLTSKRKETRNQINDSVYSLKNHDLAKRLFANLGLSFKETPEYYAPSLWVMHGDVIVGEILQEKNGEWYSNTRWGSKDYIDSSMTTKCQELAALEEIHNQITALLLNEFQNNGGLRM